MLKRLQVRNYVLIDSLETEFPAGLVIITGQTGAGKSILLGALSLLLGAKADASVIGTSSDNCVVEAEFAVRISPQLAAFLEQNEIDAEDGSLVIRRVVNHNGRSRAFVNDSPVNIQTLAGLASYLVDIHSQHQTALLTDRKFQLSILDWFAGNGSALDAYRELYRRYEVVSSELEELEERTKRAASEYEYNLARYERLEKAALKPGETEELEAEQKQLANAEDIKSALCSAQDMLSSVLCDGEEYTVASLLKDAGRRIEKISGYVPALSSLAERLESCRLEIEDAVGELDSINSNVEVSQERLEAVDARLSLLYSLFQSYSCRTVEELIAERDAIGRSLTDASSDEDRKEALRREKDVLFADLQAKAGELSERRKEAAARFSSAISESVRGLELENAEFVADVLPAGLSSSGVDAVRFRFSASGENLADVAKCASGGERSRLMLALKAMMAKFTEMPTMIFDEIDTGVSGSVADKMGSMICDMGRDMQVFAITHLPQVAAKGDAHYLVSKENVSGRAVSSVRRLTYQERVQEVARMLSGSVLTDAAIANAEVLLSQSRN